MHIFTKRLAHRGIPRFPCCRRRALREDERQNTENQAD